MAQKSTKVHSTYPKLMTQKKKQKPYSKAHMKSPNEAKKYTHSSCKWKADMNFYDPHVSSHPNSQTITCEHHLWSIFLLLRVLPSLKPLNHVSYPRPILWPCFVKQPKKWIHGAIRKCRNNEDEIRIHHFFTYQMSGYEN